MPRMDAGKKQGEKILFAVRETEFSRKNKKYMDVFFVLEFHSSAETSRECEPVRVFKVAAHW